MRNDREKRVYTKYRMIDCYLIANCRWYTTLILDRFIDWFQFILIILQLTSILAFALVFGWNQTLNGSFYNYTSLPNVSWMRFFLFMSIFTFLYSTFMSIVKTLRLTDRMQIDWNATVMKTFYYQSYFKISALTFFTLRDSCKDCVPINRFAQASFSQSNTKWDICNPRCRIGVNLMV